MIKIDEINDIYTQYKNDLNIKISLPELLILPKRNQTGIAQIDEVIPSFAELFLGDKFFDSSIMDKYLIGILYHEFTHIFDRVTLLSHIKNSKEHRNQLFPYTEFHASKVEMKKHLELFYNPQKQIRISTQIYDEKGIITLKEFLHIQLEQFELRKEMLNQNPSIENIQNIIYVVVYNIGYYSICKQFNINNNLFLQNNCIPYVHNDIAKLKNILLNIKQPSDDLCNKTHEIINKIAYEMGSYYSLL